MADNPRVSAWHLPHRTGQLQGPTWLLPDKILSLVFNPHLRLLPISIGITNDRKNIIWDYTTSVSENCTSGKTEAR